MHFEINIFEFNFRICTTLTLQIFLSLLPKNPPLFYQQFFTSNFLSGRHYSVIDSSVVRVTAQPSNKLSSTSTYGGIAKRKHWITATSDFLWRNGLVYTRTWSLECRRTLRIFYSNHESWSHFVRGKTKKWEPCEFAIVAAWEFQVAYQLFQIILYYFV